MTMNAGNLRFGSLEIVRLSSALPHQVQVTRPVERDQHRGLRAVFVSGGHVDKNLPLLADRLLGIERGIVAAEDLAVRQPHRELEGFPLGIALVGEIGIDLVVGTDDDVAVAFRARFLGILLVGKSFVHCHANEDQRQETASET